MGSLSNLPFVASLSNLPFVVSLSRVRFVVSLSRVRFVVSLSRVPFVVSLSRVPFVVSLSNHGRHSRKLRGPYARVASLILALLMLAACESAGGVLQSAGGVDVFDMQLTSDLAWARIKDPLQREEIWTIDGMALNSLSIFSGIEPGQHVFMLGHERSSRPDGPWFRAGMRPEEIRDIVVAGMTGLRMVNITTSNLRPQKFGGIDGLRFEFTMASTEGLIYRGTVAAAERDGKLDLLLWKAPAEYYHDRDAAAVARMLDGLRFK
ncbi:MAG TPA: hypothetical protein VGH80_13020 [Xanthomonadaceae bacterium]